MPVGVSGAETGRIVLGRSDNIRPVDDFSALVAYRIQTTNGGKQMIDSTLVTPQTVVAVSVLTSPIVAAVIGFILVIVGKLVKVDVAIPKSIAATHWIWVTLDTLVLKWFGKKNGEQIEESGIVTVAKMGIAILQDCINTLRANNAKKTEDAPKPE
jgi:hypothetical protein